MNATTATLLERWCNTKGKQYALIHVSESNVAIEQYSIIRLDPDGFQMIRICASKSDAHYLWKVFKAGASEADIREAVVGPMPRVQRPLVRSYAPIKHWGIRSALSAIDALQPRTTGP